MSVPGLAKVSDDGHVVVYQRESDGLYVAASKDGPLNVPEQLRAALTEYDGRPGWLKPFGVGATVTVVADLGKRPGAVVGVDHEARTITVRLEDVQ